MTLKFMGFQLDSETGFETARTYVRDMHESLKTHGADPEFKLYVDRLRTDIADFATDLIASAQRGLTVSPRQIKELDRAETIFHMADAPGPAVAAFRTANHAKGSNGAPGNGMSWTKKVTQAAGAENGEIRGETNRVRVSHFAFGDGPL